MRAFQAVLTIAVVMLSIAPSVRAERLGRGNSLAWIGLNGNRSQLLNSPLSIEENSEVGIHAAYSYFLNDAWTVVASGGLATGKSRFETGFTDPFKYASHSWNLRFGFDRYAFISDNVAIYAGPGFLYWKGHAEIPDTGLGVGHLPDVEQFAFNGRLGMLTHVTGRIGLFGHVGQTIGANSSEDSGVKSSWWSSTHEGSVGLSVDF